MGGKLTGTWDWMTGSAADRSWHSVAETISTASGLGKRGTVWLLIAVHFPCWLFEGALTRG